MAAETRDRQDLRTDGRCGETCRLTPERDLGRALRWRSGSGSERRRLGCRPDGQGDVGQTHTRPPSRLPRVGGLSPGEHRLASVLTAGSVFRDDRDRASELRGGRDQGWTELPAVCAVAERVSASPGLGRVDTDERRSQSCSGTDGNRLGSTRTGYRRGWGEADPP